MGMEPQTNTPTVPESSQPVVGNRPDSPSTLVAPQATGPGNQPPQEIKIKKKNKHTKTLLVVLLCEILIGVGIAAYFWRDNLAMQQQNVYEEMIMDLEDEIKGLKEGLGDDGGMDMDDEYYDFPDDDF